MPLNIILFRLATLCRMRSFAWSQTRVWRRWEMPSRSVLTLRSSTLRRSRSWVSTSKNSQWWSGTSSQAWYSQGWTCSSIKWDSLRWIEVIQLGTFSLLMQTTCIHIIWLLLCPGHHPFKIYAVKLYILYYDCRSTFTLWWHFFAWRRWILVVSEVSSWVTWWSRCTMNSQSSPMPSNLEGMTLSIQPIP